MFAQTGKVFGTLFILTAVSWTGGWQTALADDSWRVVKSSGEVWMLRGEAQLVAIRTEAMLNPGDNIQTGRSGRVLLARGEERILISPNSAIGLPVESRSGTTIRQQAGSILLEVQKKNVPHFEVETPYLAAVVKGTQFRVSVNNADARVDVLRGQVQVSDHKSGQQIVLLPGQAAMASANGAGGLSLSGKGQFNPVEQGKPRATGLRALSIPKGGLQPQRLQSNQSRQLGNMVESSPAEDTRGKTSAVQRLPGGAIRIGTTLGEVKLDYQKVTKGLARSASELVVASSKRRSGGGDAYASATGDLSRAASDNSSSSKSLALNLGNATGSNSNGLALSVGGGSSGGGGLAVSMGDGNGSGSGLSLGAGSGSGGGLTTSVGGTGVALGIGNGSGGGLSLGLTNGNGNGLILGLGKNK
jgi:hypothetical protein